MAEMRNTKRDISMPANLCWPMKPDQLDAGSPVYVLEELPGNRVSIMSLAGPMVVSRDDVEMPGENHR